MKLEVHQLDPELPLLGYAREGDAGLDLMARNDVLLNPAGGRAAIRTGIAVALQTGHAGLVVPRSGMANAHGVTVLNAPGVIDSGYRGEIVVILVNHDPEEPYEVHRGDRVAQLLVIPAAACTVTAVAALTPSDRGSGALGHTGR